MQDIEVDLERVPRKKKHTFSFIQVTDRDRKSTKKPSSQSCLIILQIPSVQCLNIAASVVVKL